LNVSVLTKINDQIEHYEKLSRKFWGNDGYVMFGKSEGLREAKSIILTLRNEISIKQLEAANKAQQHNKILPDEKTVAAIWAGIDLKLSEVLASIGEEK